MPVTTEKPAPYAPPSAILDLIERHRSRGLPSPVNMDVLARSGVSESLTPRTMQALHTLDLIDENGALTKTFEAIRLAPEAEYKKQLENWLKAAYADVFAFVDPAKDDETAIRDAFRTYQPTGQQPRMVSLFQALCTAAGLAPERTTPPPRPRAVPNLRGPSKPSILGSVVTRQATKPSASHAVPPEIMGLFAGLPQNGWTKEQRDKFVTTFETVLDYCIPTIEAEEPAEDGKE